jgi:hypothetical protein
MDYKGQQLCEYIYSIITIVFSVIAWFVGYFKGDFLLTFYGWAAGLVLALLVSEIAYFRFFCHFLNALRSYVFLIGRSIIALKLFGWMK